jgi:hypothetical protein
MAGCHPARACRNAPSRSAVPIFDWPEPCETPKDAPSEQDVAWIFDGYVQLEYRPDGVLCTIELPVASAGNELFSAMSGGFNLLCNNAILGI